LVFLIKFCNLYAAGFARVAELVDAPDLGSGPAWRVGGSSPFSRTSPLFSELQNFMGKDRPF
jgi:hypothetical protein